MQTMDITYPLLEGIELREESLQLFNKLKASSAADLETVMLKASPLTPAALDGQAYVGYRKAAGNQEKVIKGFVQLDDSTFGVYEVPAQQDGGTELWLPTYGQNGLIKLGVQGFGSWHEEKLVVSYGMHSERYYAADHSARVLVVDVTKEKSLEYLVLAKSRPIMDTVAKRIKAVLNAVREGKHSEFKNPHDRG